MYNNGKNRVHLNNVQTSKKSEFKEIIHLSL